ncbi:MAG: DUF655 domain-containing protein [Thermoprotei archaeon]|nr:MAG: DUF655 domain-containing protein [Thermoprotei archaeon]
MKPFYGKKQFMEDYVYILDYLPFGYGPGYMSRYEVRYRGPIAQAIGESYFTLLEVTPLPGLQFNIRDRVYLGRVYDESIVRVTRRLSYDELTATAKAELPVILQLIVKKREKEYVDFFNKAAPLTKKMHSLELLRGIGKRTLWKILEERRRKPFESFDDIKERTKIDPVKVIVERIIEELSEPQRHYLFVPPQVIKRPRPRF